MDTWIARKHAHAVKEQLRVSGQMAMFCKELVMESRESIMSRLGDVARFTAEQIQVMGSQSLGLVMAAGAATGAVMALQFANGLQRFGGTLYVPGLVALSVLRELGPVLTSLLLAGRVGSGITSELASMEVTDQIDAIISLGDSPLFILVLPRLIACLIVFPILALFGDFVSILSAMLVSWFQLSMSPSFFYSKMTQIILPADLWTGIAKTVVFAGFIGVAASWRGLHTTKGTRGVGESTTWIIVRASIFILVSDFFLSKLFIMTVLRNG